MMAAVEVGQGGKWGVDPVHEGPCGLGQGVWA